MRHARAVIVGRGNFQLVKLREENFPFSVKNKLRKNLVEGVDAHVLVILAGSDTAGTAEAKPDVCLRGFQNNGLRRLLGSGLVSCGQFGIERVLHRLDDGLARVGGAADDIHLRVAFFNDGGGDRFKSRSRYGRGLVLLGYLNLDDLAAFHLNSNAYRSIEPVSRACQGFCRSSSHAKHERRAKQ